MNVITNFTQNKTNSINKNSKKKTTFPIRAIPIDKNGAVRKKMEILDSLGSLKF